MPKKRAKKIRTFSSRQHPCWRWCGQRILGIVENGKLLGEIPQDAEFDVRSAVGPTYVPAGALQLTCQHDRLYVLAEKS
jgi:hypothetical protein